MYIIRRVIVAHAGQLKAGKAWSETSRETHVDAWGVWHHELVCVAYIVHHQKSHVEAGHEAGRTGIAKHLVERATY